MQTFGEISGIEKRKPLIIHLELNSKEVTLLIVISLEIAVFSVTDYIRER